MNLLDTIKTKLLTIPGIPRILFYSLQDDIDNCLVLSIDTGYGKDTARGINNPELAIKIRNKSPTEAFNIEVKVRKELDEIHPIQLDEGLLSGCYTKGYPIVIGLDQKNRFSIESLFTVQVKE